MSRVAIVRAVLVTTCVLFSMAAGASAARAEQDDRLAAAAAVLLFAVFAAFAVHIVDQRENRP